MYKKCTKCHGLGKYVFSSGASETCNRCGGKGHVFETEANYSGSIAPLIILPHSWVIFALTAFLIANFYSAKWFVISLSLLAGLILIFGFWLRSKTVLIIACIFAVYPAIFFRSPLIEVSAKAANQITGIFALNENVKNNPIGTASNITAHQKAPVLGQKKEIPNLRSGVAKQNYFDVNNSLIAAGVVFFVFLLVALIKFPGTLVVFAIISSLIYIFGGTHWLFLDPPIAKAKQLIWANRDAKIETIVHKEKDTMTDASHLGTVEKTNKRGASFRNSNKKPEPEK